MLFIHPVAYISQETLAITPPASSNPADNLQIALATDKTIYAVGDEIHFEVVLSNTGYASFRVLLDSVFVGSSIKCTDLQGNKYAYDGGYLTWSPKVNVHTGRTYLLKPDEKMTIKMDALVYDNYKLIFSNLFDRRGSSGYQDFKKRANLPPDFPDKYLSAGRIFPLLKPGTYRVTYVYETAEHDKQWWTFTGARTPEEASVDLLLIGKATSNTIELIIK
jgi:hypothetical protein